MLLNDLFGIQSRAGCSCAGPYGHRLLSIDREKSLLYKQLVRARQLGAKPGWVRVGLHFLMTDEEFEFVCDAILFVAEFGKYFLQAYSFDLKTGCWCHKCFNTEQVAFGVDSAISATEKRRSEKSILTKNTFRSYLDAARCEARKLESTFLQCRLRTTNEKLIPFLYYE